MLCALNRMNQFFKPLERLHPHFLRGISTAVHLLNLHSWQERRRFHTAVQVFKILNKLCPSYLRDWFINAEAYTGRSGCNRDHLFISQVSTNIGKSGLFLSWNSDLE